MLELLQEKNNQRVVLIKTGIFYIATGKDAIFLNKVLKLKCTCFLENVCKVGIPETSLPKYLERLDRLDVSYIRRYSEDKYLNAFRKMLEQELKGCE